MSTKMCGFSLLQMTRYLVNEKKLMKKKAVAITWMTVSKMIARHVPLNWSKWLPNFFSLQISFV